MHTSPRALQRGRRADSGDGCSGGFRWPRWGHEDRWDVSPRSKTPAVTWRTEAITEVDTSSCPCPVTPARASSLLHL